jgi:hypothetical protein
VKTDTEGFPFALSSTGPQDGLVYLITLIIKQLPTKGKENLQTPWRFYGFFGKKRGAPIIAPAS